MPDQQPFCQCLTDKVHAPHRHEPQCNCALGSPQKEKPDGWRMDGLNDAPAATHRCTPRSAAPPRYTIRGRSLNGSEGAHAGLHEAQGDQ